MFVFFDESKTRINKNKTVKNNGYQKKRLYNIILLLSLPTPPKCSQILIAIIKTYSICKFTSIKLSKCAANWSILLLQGTLDLTTILSTHTGQHYVSDSHL